jgi:uncharacterized membrane protein YqjE
MEKEEEHNKSHIQRLFVLIPNIIEHHIALLKLSMAEYAVNGLNKFLSGIVILIFGSFIILFLSIASALWIGQVLNNYALGFLIVALLYLVLMLAIIYLIKPLITKPIFKSIIDALDDENEN